MTVILSLTFLIYSFSPKIKTHQLMLMSHGTHFVEMQNKGGLLTQPFSSNCCWLLTAMGYQYSGPTISPLHAKKKQLKHSKLLQPYKHKTITYRGSSDGPHLG